MATKKRGWAAVHEKKLKKAIRKTHTGYLVVIALSLIIGAAVGYFAASFVAGNDKFELNGRTFLLMRATVDWYTAKRLAEMLGGKLATLHSEEEQKQAASKLSKFDSMSIALGAYRRNGSGLWLNGKSAPENLPINKQSPFNSLNSCFMALRYNQYCWSDTFDAFLCEL